MEQEIVVTDSDNIRWTGTLRHVTSSPRYVGWRNLHRPEGGFPTDPRFPNVRRAKDAPAVPFTPALQRLAFDLMVYKNPAITRTKFESVFASGTAFCNNQHGIKDDDPQLMDGIVCAGMFTTTQPVGGYMTMTPGVHAVDATKPLPSVAEVLERGWYFIANTGQGSQGAFNFPQGMGGPVYIVYALVAPVRYPMSGVEEGISWTGWARWDSTVRPDALRYGG